ncbi:alpha/beta fold hydrolase [Sedimenticola sp.]|uniref:alpha/beta fold hydrolase n=1 Tax=Sedimenticola sp. TaxID=1940285 RepID=UPI003D0D4A81
MRIVLLPGMDGTGRLFSPLLPFLDKDSTTIISYPTVGKQDYDTLAEHVKSKLPDEEFILVAESFSGPIGAILAKSNIPNLKAIVFVATFLSTPSRPLLKIVRHLPIKLFSKMPFVSAIYRFYMFDPHAGEGVLSLFKDVLAELPSKTLKQRMAAIQSLKPSGGCIELPAVYIRPEEDRLVPYSKCLEFKSLFKNLSVRSISGPHFIIQVNPEECARVINSVHAC